MHQLESKSVEASLAITINTPLVTLDQDFPTLLRGEIRSMYFLILRRNLFTDFYMGNEPTFASPLSYGLWSGKRKTGMRRIPHPDYTFRIDEEIS